MPKFCPFTIDDDSPIMGLSDLNLDRYEPEPFEEFEMATAKKKVTTKPTAAPQKPKTADDSVTLAVLSEELGISTAVARRKLRAAGLIRPEGQGWKWKPGSKDLDKVRKILSEPEPKE